jgi:hypothetical protein
MTTNEKLLMLFVILLLGLILCSFLGGRGCSKEGFESASGATITSENGNMMINGEPLTATGENSNTYKNKDWSVYFDQYGNANATDASGEYTTESFEAEGDTADTSGSSSSGTTSGSSDYYPSSDTSDSYDHYSGSYSTTYTGDNGTATVTKIGDKGKLITVNDSGSIKLYYIPNSGTKGTTKNGPNDGAATIVTNGDGTAYILITMPDGTKYTYYANYNKNSNNTSSTSTSAQNDVNNLNSAGSDYANAYVYTGPGGNSAGAVTTPAGNTYAGTNYDTNANAYYNSLPPGINANQIPPGQEDLYILKSQVVPPVCPRCPDPIVQSSESTDLSKVPPCPPCARCPEPAFDCKKVPNYNAFNPDYMPVPVISDFSGFGM